MKKAFKSSFWGIAFAGLLLASCSQLSTFELEDLVSEQAKSQKEGFTLSPYGNSSGNENAFILEGNIPDCESAPCIPAERSRPVVLWGENITQTRTSGKNSKSVFLFAVLWLEPDNTAYYQIVGVSQKTSGNAQSAVFFSGTVGGYSFGSTTEKAGQYTRDPSFVEFHYTSPSFDYTTIECGDSFDLSFVETSFAEEEQVILSRTLYFIAICGPE